MLIKAASIRNKPGRFFGGNDWTDTQAVVDRCCLMPRFRPCFMHPQYGAFSAWSTVAHSNYNAADFSFRERSTA